MQDPLALAQLIMKILKKVGAGLLLSLGFFCLMIAIGGLVDKDETPQEERESLDTVIGGIAFGVPLMAAGGWIIRGLRKQYQKDISDRLQSVFYQLVQQKNGYINVLNFATAAQIMPIVHVGSQGERQVYGCILHLDIKDGKIWLQHNGTENDIAAELVEMGVPKSDIIIGFHSAFKRQFTEYAGS